MKTGAQVAHAAEDEGGYAIAEEIRKNLFGFIPAVRGAMGLGRCPVCGSRKIMSRIRRPRIVVDGPTVIKMTCAACGHKWHMTLRAGP